MENEKKTKKFVRMVRLELTQDYSYYPLKVACLPFHHIRIIHSLQSSLNIFILVNKSYPVPLGNFTDSLILGLK